MEEKKHALLHYGDNIGAPAIKLEDIQGWKTHTVVKANHEFDAKYEEIKREYLKLLDEYEWTHKVYKAAFNFEPTNMSHVNEIKGFLCQRNDVDLL